MRLLFIFRRKTPKDAAWKTWFFAYIISRKQRATQRKNFEAINVSLVKQSPQAKIQLFLNTFKK